MATLNTKDMRVSILTKIEELNAKIEEMKGNPNLSEATVRTQAHLKSHEAHSLQIIYDILMNFSDGTIEMSDDTAKWFASATTLTKDRKKGSIIFKEGDNMITIMDEHPNINYKKLKEMLAKQGFALSGSTVVKA